MIRLGIDAPNETRASVAFNDDAYGVLILAAKAREDARNFRWIAELIRKGEFGAALKPNAERAAGRCARSPINSNWPPTAATRRHDDGRVHRFGTRF